MTYGSPGSVTPATLKSRHVRCASYQRLGICWPRCISFDKSGLPETVCAPDTTQLLEPTTKRGSEASSQVSILRAKARATELLSSGWSSSSSSSPREGCEEITLISVGGRSWVEELT